MDREPSWRNGRMRRAIRAKSRQSLVAASWPSGVSTAGARRAARYKSRAVRLGRFLKQMATPYFANFNGAFAAH